MVLGLGKKDKHNMVRIVEDVLWTVISPSRYVLFNYPSIEAYYDGKGHWRVTNSDELYASLADISHTVVEAENYAKNLEASS